MLKKLAIAAIHKHVDKHLWVIINLMIQVTFTTKRNTQCKKASLHRLLQEQLFQELKRP